MHLAARLNPDQLGSLHCSPNPWLYLRKGRERVKRKATTWIEAGKIWKRKGKATERDGYERKRIEV